jgi:quercetin dioxygenase-like cupin family protein
LQLKLSFTPPRAGTALSIPPRGIVPWHSHPIPAAGYLLSGEVTIEEENGAHHKFTAGQVIAEPVNVLHRGTAGDQGAVIIAFYAAAEGTRLSQPKP